MPRPVTRRRIDLSAYNSTASAADLNDLRLALGYEKLDLYTDSYSTRLALTLMRDHPDSVRNAVLDFTYPLQMTTPRAERRGIVTKICRIIFSIGLLLIDMIVKLGVRQLMKIGISINNFSALTNPFHQQEI